MKKWISWNVLCLIFIVTSSVLISAENNDLHSTTAIKSSAKVENYGHRGCRGLRPENTIPAYKKALEIGVDFVDMDVNMTEDGVVVVTHNSSLNPDFTRNQNGKWITSKKHYIKNMSYKVLETYDVGKAKPGTDYAEIFKHQKAVDGTHIPTLKEVIQFVKKNADYPVQYQIELKTWPFGLGHSTKPKKLVDAVYKIMKSENVIDETEVQCFYWGALMYMNSLDSSVHTSYLMLPPLGIGVNNTNMENVSPETLCGLNSVEVETLKRENYKAIGMKEQFKKTDAEGIYDFYNNLMFSIKKAGGYAVEPMIFLTSKEFIKAAKENGLKVVPWDSESLLKTDYSKYAINIAIENNVDGIITDRPDILKKRLEKNENL